LLSFFLNKNEGIYLGLISGSNIGSSMARNCSPQAIILPIMLGFSKTILEQWIVSDEFGVGITYNVQYGHFYFNYWFYMHLN